ncbi:putative bifunctional diguanylate cyclase/phosphodiesterase [Rhodovulum sp. DZ06]|uniref:putative bifunctional diguanylate cyclase/phosphodiesterase n=1 Tax=Rhodovulum sp. DZ06 TaxID=3425126 RepID=UPI003D33145C
MITRSNGWAWALGMTAAVAAGGGVYMSRLAIEADRIDDHAAALFNVSQEFEHLIPLTRAIARLPETTENDPRLAKEELQRITTLIRDWRGLMAGPDRRADGADGAAAAGTRLSDAAWTRSVVEAAERAQLLVLRHPRSTQAESRELSEAAQAALPYAEVAAAQTRAEAELARENLRFVALGWVGLIIAALAGTGFGLVRPMARERAERGETIRELERRMLHGARHDPLTGLPNRKYLAEHGARMLAAAGRGGRVAAALHVNLDKFKAINDTLGMKVGDDVLRRVSLVLRAETRRGDFVARVGADEFVVMISEVVTLEQLVSLAARLIERIGEPTVAAGEEVRATACVGIALAEPEKVSVDRLLMNADLALFDAKAGGRGRYAFFTDNRRAEFETRRRVANELRDAIAREQLEPFFQPQVCARTGRPLGFEALVRWRHPERGLLTPFHFLDVAKETGLIEQIGEIVTRRALSALAVWRSMGLPANRIGLNISAKELRDSAFVDKLAWDVDAAGLEPRNIGVEILESVLIEDDSDPMIRNVAALSAAGFSVELDDFGTGHASIANLKKFRVNKIKIDRSFVTDIDTQPEQQKITRAMINLAHSLDVEALVEGVETHAELRRLRAMGCDAVQGYLVGRPMSEADATAWLKAQAEHDGAAWGESQESDLLSGGLGV